MMPVRGLHDGGVSQRVRLVNVSSDIQQPRDHFHVAACGRVVQWQQFPIHSRSSGMQQLRGVQTAKVNGIHQWWFVTAFLVGSRIVYFCTPAKKKLNHRQFTTFKSHVQGCAAELVSGIDVRSAVEQQ